MRHDRIGRSPRVIRRAGLYLDNIVLIPASLLPDKEHWLQVANNLPQGDILIVLPWHAKQQRIAHSVACHLRKQGKHVRVMDRNLRWHAPGTDEALMRLG